MDLLFNIATFRVEMFFSTGSKMCFTSFDVAQFKLH